MLDKRSVELQLDQEDVKGKSGKNLEVPVPCFSFNGLLCVINVWFTIDWNITVDQDRTYSQYRYLLSQQARHIPSNDTM